ncbi:AraC family transcriptional regulator [Flagellimonas taeanensis]|uniref:AraC-type DNA-binding protein n=2 Tax=Flavobacteriales TaxID=200644 RepID=A0A1M6P8E2_9FLAO|nr:AraC family transcriptional regulator [Allomuricauda taeanensis]SFB66420.1 AraC-type DNA-binding protein [Allomuricauda taeanensis]SHK04195.1 AraC-type DNA-binding protein [Allomuricauda taeanensis]
MHIKVKNMVCDRCKSVLKRELQKAGIEVVQIELGEVELSEGAKGQMELIREILMQNGFELIEDQEDSFIAEIKKNLIIALENGIHQNLSDHLSKSMKKEYSMLSKMFSAKEGVTIERYFILLKIERVKEQIQMGSKTFSEIAYDLDYASSSHLAKQFKSVTGMSMTDYRKVQQWNRKSLDQIV